MQLSNTRNSSNFLVLLHTLVSLLAVSGMAEGRGPAGIDLDLTCEFVADARTVAPQGFSGPGLLVTGSVSTSGDVASLSDQVCGGVTIALEEQGKGPWTNLFQTSADASADGTFSQLVPLCSIATQNPDASVVRATASVLVSATTCTDGSTKTLTRRCTDSSRQGNRPAVSLPPGPELDEMCADANI